MQRQMLAVALTMLSMALLHNKRILFSIVIMLMGIGIHSTALIALIGFFIWKVPKSGKGLLLTSLVTVFCTTLFGKMFSVFSQFFSHYSIYSNYLSNSKYEAGGGSILLGLFLICIIVVGSTTTNILDNDKWGFVLFMTQIGGILYVMGGHSQLLVRMAEYFAVYSIVALPILIEEISKKFIEYKVIRFALSSTTIFIGIILLIYKLFNNFGEIVPYVFIR
ncbi:hypothetical protein LNA01_15680 [Companilactobacillus nantensis]|nr:hypothetical protein LNA01_15680 [Companilactobacillus nantensis]